MPLTELLPILQQLPRADKLRLVQFLVSELAKEEGVPLLSSDGSYAVWTPYNAFSAADTLLKALAEDQSPLNG